MALRDFDTLLRHVERGTLAPEALETLEEQAAAFPRHVTPRIALARACEQQGRPEEARRHWRHAQLIAPTLPAVRDGLRRTDPHPSAGHAFDGDAFAWDPPMPSESSSVRLREVLQPSADDPDDLDGLIAELEGARIEPTPDPDGVPTPDLESGDGDMVSPTLARIYEAQGQYADAARVYRRLAEERPDEADAFHRQAQTLDAQAEREASDESA